METTKLMNDGHTIPRLGLGVWRLENDRAADLVAEAIAAGYRHIDTAQGNDNEEGVGHGIAGCGVPRTELFVTSKLRTSHHGHENTLLSFAETMDRLALDYLDLFLIHWPVPQHDRYVEIWKALIELRETGRLRSIGVSNFTVPQLERLIDETGVVPAVNQIELNPFFQQRELRDFHREQGIVIESYSPLGGDGAVALRHPVVQQVAEKHSRSAAQVVIRWHLQQGLIVLPKTSKPERLAENFSVWEFELNPAHMAALDALDRPDGKVLPHPEQMNTLF